MLWQTCGAWLWHLRRGWQMGGKQVREHTWWERQLRQGFTHPLHDEPTYPLPAVEVERLGLMERLRAGWDEEYADLGEGPAHGGGAYLAVVVADDRGRAMCTFFIRAVDGAATELFVAEIHRGLPPNPYVESMGRELMWRAADVVPGRRDARPIDPETGRVDVFTDYLLRHVVGVNDDVDRNPGQRPARVEVIYSVSDRDVRFRFPTSTGPWTVRGSVLAPVLLAMRGAGMRKVELGFLRRTLNRA